MLLLQTFAEKFTSMIEISDLMQAPTAIQNAINIYVKMETNRLQILKRFIRAKKSFISTKFFYSRLLIEIDESRCSTAAAADTNEDEYENCMQREDASMSMLYDNTRKILAKNTNILAENHNTLLNILSQIALPAGDDVSSAIVALIRVQITYKLATDQLANGVIVGKKVTKQLNGTCYIIKTLRTY
jgi:hypothetical protein